ncbi:hypothetical protein EJB05_51157 [Eragrostis curvula]|uniref:Uncharacterized protein n=1 Tax=Eragrostis curvula TaxID=38414 RepID=A0A5J9SWE0_9POAL|nr:hypothetical protein EJB05_51157 [Eragrostis curvula]
MATRRQGFTRVARLSGQHVVAEPHGVVGLDGRHPSALRPPPSARPGLACSSHRHSHQLHLAGAGADERDPVAYSNSSSTKVPRGRQVNVLEVLLTRLLLAPNSKLFTSLVGDLDVLKDIVTYLKSENDGAKATKITRTLKLLPFVWRVASKECYNYVESLFTVWHEKGEFAPGDKGKGKVDNGQASSGVIIWDHEVKVLLSAWCTLRCGTGSGSR